MRWLILVVMAVTLPGCSAETTEPSVNDPPLPVATLPSTEPSTVDSQMPGDEGSTTGETAHAGEPEATNASDQSGEPLTAEQREAVELFDQLTQQATRLYQAGQYSQAVSLVKTMLELDRKAYGNEHPRYAESLNNLAVLYQSMSEYAKAEPLLLQARDITKKVLGEEHPDYATSLNNLAMLYQSMSEYAKAEPLLLQARDITKKVLGEDHPDYAISLNNLAGLYELMGEYAQAEPLFRQARDILKKVLGEKHPDYAISLSGLALLYKSMGEYGKAEPLCLQARDIDKQVLGEEHPDYANSLNNLAGLYQSMGEYARAEPPILQALDIRKKILGEKHPHYANSLNSLAEFYRAMGEYARAEPLYRQALEIRKAVLGDTHPDYATSLNSLAVLYQSTGKYARAEPLFRQALDIEKKVLGEEHPSYAASLNNLATLYQSMGQYARAEPLFRQTLAIGKAVLAEKHPVYARSLNNLAGLYKSMGEYGKAEPLCLQARDIDKQVLGEEHPDYANSLNNLAGLYQSMGQFSKAEGFSLQAFDVLSKSAALTLPALSEAQAMAWLGKNRPRLDVVLTCSRASGSRPPEEVYRSVWQGRSLMWRLLGTRGLPADASDEVRQVYTDLQRTRKRLAQLTMAVPETGRLQQNRQELVKANNQKETLEKKLASLSELSSRELAVRDAKVEDLMKLLPEGVAVVDIVATGIWRNVAVKKGESDEEKSKLVAALEYEAFVLRRTGKDSEYSVDWIHLGPSVLINTAVADWRKAIRNRTGRGVTLLTESGRKRSTKAGAANTLRRLVWQKIEPHLKDCRTIVMIPDGRLTALPWGALPGSKPSTVLLEKYAFVTVPFAQQLYGQLRRQPKLAAGLVLAGDIDYAKRPQAVARNQSTVAKNFRRPVRRRAGEQLQWSGLSGTKQESEQIAALYRKRYQQQTTVLAGRRAGERTLAKLIQEARYVHLATHGFFAPPSPQDDREKDLRRMELFGHAFGSQSRGASLAGRNPLLLSGIVLAGANLGPQKDKYGLPTGEDGILTAEEVRNLHLHGTELVVLSACETGLGDVANNEGVFGLQRAFLQAGARTTVASLWKVDDNATQALMVEFYRNLWEKKLGKLESLRQAQLTMIKGYDPQTGAVRGLGKKPVPLVSSKEKPKRLPPFYWAAFQLSGDWR